MPLRILLDEEGVYCPVIVCEWCNQRITTAREGNLMWTMGPPDMPRFPLPLIFVHKRCTRAAEARYSNLPPGARWGTAELRTLPWSLLINLEMMTETEGTKIKQDNERKHATRRLRQLARAVGNASDAPTNAPPAPAVDQEG